MKTFVKCLLIATVAGISLTHGVGAQDDAAGQPVGAVRELDADAQAQQDDNRDEQIAELQKQVSRLEGRLEVLERLLLTRLIDSDPRDIGQLQRRLEVARETFDHSQRLYEKGYISQAQLQSDRYSVEKAELRLELAQMASDRAESAASLQMLDAQAELEMAKSRYEASVRLAARGYITESQLRADELAVEVAETRVESIRKLLEGEREEPNGQ